MPTFLPPARALVAGLALVLAVSACDTYYDDGYDDGYNDGQTERPRVRVVDFSLDGDDYRVSDDGFVASFESDDIRSQSQRNALQTALRTAGDGAVVVAYIDTDLVIDSGNPSNAYSALPLTRAQDAFVNFDLNNDGTVSPGEGIPYVDYVLSYEYSFDNEDFYFDVVSSASGNDFGGGARAFFDAAIPLDVRLRVVSIPGEVFNKTSVDLTDYAAVRAAFNLPE